MHAGVDHVLMGAGNPADLPGIIGVLARHEPVELPVRVQGATATSPSASTLPGSGRSPRGR